MVPTQAGATRMETTARRGANPPGQSPAAQRTQGAVERASGLARRWRMFRAERPIIPWNRYAGLAGSLGVWTQGPGGVQGPMEPFRGLGSAMDRGRCVDGKQTTGQLVLIHLARISHRDSESWVALAKQIGRSPAEA